jgi:hypothetical protein
VKFRLNPRTADANLSFLLNGPGRHLRSVVVQFRSVNWWPTNSTEDEEEEDSLSYEERVLKAVAIRARKLEHLEIHNEARHRLHMPKAYIYGRYGIVMDFPECSYMEPPLCLPGLSPGKIPQYPTDEQLAAVLEYLAPGDDGKQFAMREMISEDFKPNRRSFWNLIWRELRATEAQKRFWGQKMFEMLKLLSPTLRTVDCLGVVDKRWMVAVADLLEVRVRGGLLNGLGDWITVHPSSQPA